MSLTLKVILIQCEARKLLRVTKLRDENKEVPANFNDFMNMWSLESITCISINQRLGLVRSNQKDERAEKLIKTIRKFFELEYQFEVLPTVWRFYQTKAFKELMKTYDDLTK